MKLSVQFISSEEDENDLLIAFAIPDPRLSVRSLTLLRSPAFEGGLEDSERGVRVSLEGDESEDDYSNLLRRIRVSKATVSIEAVFGRYELDVSGVDPAEVREMLEVLKKQNYDGRFQIEIV